jgi:hypothetical protein
MSSSRLYVQLGYLLHLSSTTHKNAAAAGFANGPRTYYNYMIWGIPMGKYAQQQCHGMELKSHKKKGSIPPLSHLQTDNVCRFWSSRHVRMNSVIFWSNSLHSTQRFQCPIGKSPSNPGGVDLTCLFGGQKWQVEMWRATDAATPGWTTGWSRTTSWDKLMPLYVGNPMVKYNINNDNSNNNSKLSKPSQKSP